MPKPRPGEVLFRVRVRGAVRRPGKHAYDVEMLFGDSASADGSGKRLAYVFDRRGDRRHKRLIDPDTGEVLLEESGRLSDHHGHGSAKPR